MGIYCIVIDVVEIPFHVSLVASRGSISPTNVLSKVQI